MLLKLSKFFLYLALFSVLIVLSTIFFPFIGGKYYFFRTAVSFAVVSLILWWAFEAPPGALALRFRKAMSYPLVVAVSAFAIAFLLACLFAHDPSAAFWSNYERGEGGFQMLHYYAFFLLLVMLFDREEDWRLAFKLSLFAAILLILYGVGAAGLYEGFLGPYAPGGQPLAPTFWSRLFSDARFQGSLGNPAYVAPYLFFAMCYAAYLWLTSRSRKVAWVVYGLFLVVALTIFILSETRGAFIGLGVAVFAFLGYLIITSAATRRWALPAVAAVLLLVGSLYYFRNSPLIENVPGRRLLDLNLLQQSSAQTRLWTWGSAWQGFLERPVLGWGPENFSAVFDKHFDPRHYVPGTNSETWFDRAHSVVFDYLAETGILGFASYLGMFAVLYWEFYRTRRKVHPDEAAAAPPGRGHRSPMLRALLFAVPVGYLVQGLILFDVLPIYLNLFLFLAFCTYWTEHSVLFGRRRAAGATTNAHA